MNFNPSEEFDWDLPNKMAVNQKVKVPEGSKVYCHESYAQELSDLYFSNFENSLEGSKDLEDGGVYECKVTHMSEGKLLAQTFSGQTVYVDVRKEEKDAQRLNLEAFEFKIGDSIKARVRRIAGSYVGSVVEYYIHSLRIELFEQIKKESNAYRVKVESINKGGYIVDLSGVKCFLPGSLAAANRITDFESYIGKEIPVMIEGYVEVKDIFIVSYKKYINKIMNSKIQELDLTKKYKGLVTGTSDFGVFVEWEEVYTGLIHKSEFQEDSNISTFHPGDEIEFYVKEIKENNRLTLTLEKPLERNVIIHDLDRQVKEGVCEPVYAKVKHRRKNGALIELTPYGLMALIPQDKLVKRSRNLKNGDELMVAIYEVETISGKIYAEPVNEQ